MLRRLEDSFGQRFPTSRPRRTGVLGLLALLAATGLLAQSATPAPSSDDPSTPPIVINDSFSVEMVLVPTVVRGRKGYVYDLKKKDFVLSVDYRPVPIESFERGADAPLSLVLMQDLSGSMAEEGKIDASREIASYFVDHAFPRDEFAIATFAGGETSVEVPFTHNKETLHEALAVWRGYGTTALYDAVSWLPHLSLAGRRMKRAGILVTDGVDNASAIPPAKARDIVQQAQLPVYVFGMVGHRPPTPKDDIFRYADLLRLLATTSGGQYYSITGPEDVRKACAAILTELRHQYVLGFSVTGSGAEAYHRIRVAIRGKGKNSSVMHRQGYRGTKPAVMVHER